MKKVALPVFSKTQQPKIKSVLGLIFPDVRNSSETKVENKVTEKKDETEKVKENPVENSNLQTSRRTG